MYYSDCHTHSSCSPDGENSMLQMAQEAIRGGLEELCFTDHTDLWDWTTRELIPHDWEKPIQQFREAQEICGKQIALRLGAEFGEMVIDPEEALRKMANGPELDFVIGSVHRAPACLEWEDLYNTQWEDKQRNDLLIRGYLEEEKQLAKLAQCDVLGHLTLPLRYMYQHSSCRMTFDPYLDLVDEVLKAVVTSGIGIELNTDRGGTPMPTEGILRRYKELGGEIITIGSDSHRSQDVGKGIREGQALLKACGFSYFATFTKRKPVFHKL